NSDDQPMTSGGDNGLVWWRDNIGGASLYNIDILAAKITVTGLSACDVFNNRYTIGEATEELNAEQEHTPCDGFIEELASSSPAWGSLENYASTQAESGTVDATSFVTWLDDTDPRDWTGHQEKWKVVITNYV